MTDISSSIESASYVDSKVKEDDYIKKYAGVKWAPKFIRDTSQQILLMGGRRGAKTTNVSAKIGWTDLYFKTEMTDSFIFYASKTFDHAHSLMWNKLKAIKEFYDLDDWDMEGESRGVVKTPRNTIRILGFNDVDAIGKALGQPFKAFFIDESQEIRSDILKTVTRDAAAWGAMDYKGTVVLLGNPSRLKYHFWSQEWLKADCPKYKTSIYENPMLTDKEREDFFDEQRKIRREKKGEESPEFRRMAFGHVVFESSNSVFNITPKNYYEKAPKNLQKVIGVDLGFRQYDAIAVLGWSEAEVPGEYGKIYLLEEHQEKNKSNEELGKKIDEMCKKHDVYTVIVDTGGLGVKVLPDFMSRYSKTHWEAAEKQDKIMWIKLLQTEIAHGRFKIKKDCNFEREASLVEWDEHTDKLNDKVIHSDILDAVLYGARYCYTNLVHERQDVENEKIDYYEQFYKNMNPPVDDWAITSNDSW